MIGDILTALRKKRGYTQKDVSNRLHIGITTLSNYEHSVHQPSYENLILLADFYQVSADYLLGVTTYEPPVEQLRTPLAHNMTYAECYNTIRQLDAGKRRHLEEYLTILQKAGL